jgi:SAM-dependent methyltransferase
VSQENSAFEDYFRHLSKLSLTGKLYHRLYKSPLLYLLARRFGPRVVEVGAGIGNGVLGTFSSKVAGIDINPLAVEYCRRQGLNAQVVNADGSYPFEDGAFDTCILDNVLEHIADPRSALDECWRITAPNGGLVIAVPGVRGFDFDPDHKVFYDEQKLRSLDERWQPGRVFAMPTIVKSEKLSKSMRQYCLVAVYKKKLAANV